MKARVSLWTIVVIAVCCLSTYGDGEIAQVLEKYVVTLGENASISFEYQALVDTRGGDSVIRGKGLYADGLRLVADAEVIRGKQTTHHAVRANGQMLYQIVGSLQNPESVGRIDLATLRKQFGDAMALFSITGNQALQMTLASATPLVAQMYDLTYTDVQEVAGKETLAFKGTLRAGLDESVDGSKSKLSEELAAFVLDVNEVWFYFGKDDGLLYKMQALRRRRGPYMTVTFKNYKTGMPVKSSTFLYAVPARAKVEDRTAATEAALSEMVAGAARVPLQEGTSLAGSGLTLDAGFPIHLAGFKDAVLLLVYDRQERDKQTNTDDQLSQLSDLVLTLEGKPVYVVLMTVRHPQKHAQIMRVFKFPIAYVANRPNDRTVTTLHLLDSPSRVMVLGPPLVIKASIPLTDPEWLEKTRKAIVSFLPGRAD